MSTRRERRALKRDEERYTRAKLDRIGRIFERTVVAAPELSYNAVYQRFLLANQGSWQRFMRKSEVLTPEGWHLRWFATRYRYNVWLRFLHWANGKPLLSHLVHVWARMRFGKEAPPRPTTPRPAAALPA